MTREALRFPRWCWPWWSNLEGGKLPSVLNQKSTVTVPHSMYSTVTGIDFNSPHSHANGFPAQHTGLPSCFCSGRRFSCMQLKKEIISLLPALSASACPTNMGVCPSSTSHPVPAESRLPGFDGTPRVSRPEYSFWLSPSRNGRDIGSPAEASPFLSCLAATVRHWWVCLCANRPQHLSWASFHRECSSQCCRLATRRHCGGWVRVPQPSACFCIVQESERRTPWPSSPSAGESPTSRRAERPMPRPCMCPSKSPDRVVYPCVCRATADRLCWYGSFVLRWSYQTARHLPPGARDIVLSQVSMASLWHKCGISVA